MRKLVRITSAKRQGVCGQVSYDWCKAGYHLVHPDDDYWCQVSCDWRSTMLSSDWSAGAEVAEAAPEHSLLILRVGGDLGPDGHTSKVGDREIVL